jgi:hemerythrin
MTLVAMDEKLSLGLPLFDAQHELIAETLNELHGAIMKSAPRENISLLLHSLLSYTRNHFAAEEAAMAATQYPDLARHHKLHDDILQKAAKFVTCFDAGAVSLNLLVLHLVRDTLNHHIRKADRLYVPWLIEHGAYGDDPAGHCSDDICVGANRGMGLGSAARS